MKYSISKSFTFDYGHRVWNQSLKNQPNKCKQLHGHTGTITVHIGADELNNHMVIDFNELEFVKEFIDDVFDHKFVIDRNDPLFETITNSTKNHLIITKWGVKKIHVPKGSIVPPSMIELWNSFSIVSWPPTSENFAAYVYDVILQYLYLSDFDGLIVVESVEFSETPKTKAIFNGYTKRN